MGVKKVRLGHEEKDEGERKDRGVIKGGREKV